MMKKSICLVAVVLCLLTTSGSALKEASIQPVVRYKAIRLPFHPPPPTYYYVPNRMIVKLVSDSGNTSSLESEQNAEAEFASLDALNRKYGVTLFEQEFPGSETRTVDRASSADLSRYYIVDFSEKFPLATVMSAYRAHSLVEGVEPIGCHPTFEQIPDDPYFLTDQWNFYDAEDNDVDATDAWDLETGEMIRRFDYGGSVTGIRLSADGRLAITCGDTSALAFELYPDCILWDVATGQRRQGPMQPTSDNLSAW